MLPSELYQVRSNLLPDTAKNNHFLLSPMEARTEQLIREKTLSKCFRPLGAQGSRDDDFRDVCGFCGLFE